MRHILNLGIALFLLAPTGCIKSMAINSLGDALANGGGAYARDDDPELVRDATAFGLKTIESLLDAEPDHVGLRLAAVRGFTQYGYAFLQAEADYIEDDDYRLAAHLRHRARRFYQRARVHGLAGLSVEVEDFEARLLKDPKETLKQVESDAVGLLFWTAQAWAAAVALDIDDSELASGLDLVEAMVARAMELDPTFKEGALHDFYVAWDGGRPDAAGGSAKRAKAHMEASLKLSNHERLAPMVSFAEKVYVRQKKRAEFTALLQKVVDFDADSVPKRRLANLIAQKRARWLLKIRDDLFLDASAPVDAPPAEPAPQPTSDLQKE